MSDGPVLIPGGVASDDRGRVYFANGLDLSQCRRLYFVEFRSGNRAGLACPPT